MRHRCKLLKMIFGKWADFTVLAEEVTEANKATMKDIEIIGTVSGGVIQ